MWRGSRSSHTVGERASWRGSNGHRPRGAPGKILLGSKSSVHPESQGHSLMSGKTQNEVLVLTFHYDLKLSTQRWSSPPSVRYFLKALPLPMSTRLTQRPTVLFTPHPHLESHSMPPFPCRFSCPWLLLNYFWYLYTSTLQYHC